MMPLRLRGRAEGGGEANVAFAGGAGEEQSGKSCVTRPRPPRACLTQPRRNPRLPSSRAQSAREAALSSPPRDQSGRATTLDMGGGARRGREAEAPRRERGKSCVRSGGAAAAGVAGAAPPERSPRRPSRMVPLPGPAAAAASPRLLLLPASVSPSSAAAAVAAPPPPPASAPSPPRKRQRLAHLSPEEKAMRRKLKNRVAAQSARDRKKARMGELERQAVELEAENQKLLAENQLLRERTHSLALENQELRLRLGLPALESSEGATRAAAAPAPLGVKVETPHPHKEEEEKDEEEEEERDGTLSPRSATGSAESAALRLRVPLQQEQAQPSPALGVQVDPSIDVDTSDSSDSESDLLLGLLDSLDPDLFLGCPGLDPSCLEKQHQPPPEAPPRGEAGSLPASPGSPLGAAPSQLEAINELIRFDHEYTKPFFLELVRIEEVAASPAEGAPLEPPVSVKEEEPSEGLFPQLGISHLLASDRWPAGLLEAASDSGYEGSSSPFSDLASPLEPEYTWEEAFAKELFPQLISV
uniref:X-box-binding protein 1 n=1 Tax=Pogona vitticeps TaxID=103695 RepID=A0ABM5F1D5_9SAUR